MPDPGELANAALQLKDVEKRLVKAIAEYHPDDVVRQLNEFVDLKRKIKSAMLLESVINVPGTGNEQARNILQRIATGEPFAIERATSGSRLTEVLAAELDEAEIEELGSELFYSWFSHYEYIRALYDIGSLVLSVGKVPKNLENFVHEARSCYAFQQYAAVCALCRTMLEVAVKDLAIHNGILEDDSRNVRSFKRRHVELYDVIESLCKIDKFASHRDALHKIRRRGNDVVHGNAAVGVEEAEEFLKQTLTVVHEVYEKAKELA